MTVGYSNYSMALMAIIKNGYKYIGMLGSKAKIKTLSQGLEIKKRNRQSAFRQSLFTNWNEHKK
jgi:xanthine/CO dehydrogenase XdhC/CoxF family maturation factor